MGRWRRGGIEHYSADDGLDTLRAMAFRRPVHRERGAHLAGCPPERVQWPAHRSNFRHSSRTLSPEGMAFGSRAAGKPAQSRYHCADGGFRHLFPARISGLRRKFWGACGRATGCMRCWGITISAWMPDAITQALRRQRIEVLRNRHVTLWFGGESVYLAGVDDYGYGADVRRAMRGIPRDAATILLAHNPRIISAGLAARRKPGAFRAYAWRAGEHATAGHGVRPFARAAAVQDRMGPPGSDANLRQPGNRHDRAAVATALPGGNHPPGTAPGRPSGASRTGSREI